MVISIKRHYFFKSQPQMQRRPWGEAKHGEVAEYSLKPVQLHIFLAERIIGQIMHALARIVVVGSGIGKSSRAVLTGIPCLI
jgi:hypothetical protein